MIYKKIDFSQGGIIKLKEGIYYLPNEFSYDFGKQTVIIEGIPGKTIITSNFVEPKLIDTTAPDKYSDGLYVVNKHPYFEYGGGCAHLNLKDIQYNTAGKDCLYVQGTILIKKDGIWSRWKPGYGFKSTAGFKLFGVDFLNYGGYIISPFGMAMGDNFEMDQCSFRNVTRVFSHQVYAGTSRDIEYTHLNCYASDNSYRFYNFKIKNCHFEKIHTHILNGLPPSQNTEITGNKILDSKTMFTAFNLFVKNDSIVSQPQNISNNTFSQIITMQGQTTSLVRTSGDALIKKNKFINVNMQHVFIYGKQSVIFENEFIKPLLSKNCCILIKTPYCGSDVIIEKSTANCGGGNFVNIEGSAKVIVSGNTSIIGCASIYSRVDTTPGTYASITDNFVSADMIAYLGSKTPTNFKSLVIQNNSGYFKEKIKTFNVEIQEILM